MRTGTTPRQIRLPGPTGPMAPRGATPLGAILVAALLALAALRCNAGSGDEDPLPGQFPTDVIGLRITPTNDVLQVDLNQEAQRTFTASLLHMDQRLEDVTARVTFTSSNAAAGRLEGATFTSARLPSNKVDFTTVTATYEAGGAIFHAVANLTVVWLRQSGTSKDFFFTLPYMGAAQKQPISFGTYLQSIDSFFAVDTTSSTAAAITQLRDSLRDSIIPAVNAAAVKGAWFGVGAVEDFPVSPFGKPTVRAGQPDDQPFVLLSPMGGDIGAAQAAVNSLLVGTEPRGGGGDLPEGQIEALYQIATGAGNQVAGVVDIPARTSGLGGVGFRPGALPIVTLITDAIFHTKGEGTRACQATAQTGATMNFPTEYSGAAAAAAHTRAEAAAALKQRCARVIGVSTLRSNIEGLVSQPAGICSATQDLTQMATDTGALVPPEAWDQPQRPAGCAAGKCCTGLGGAGEDPVGGLCPLVFKVAQDGANLGAQVTSGIAQLARFARFEVVASVSGLAAGDRGEVLPAGRTTADFIRGVLPLDAFPPPAPPVIPAPTIAGDRFTGVTPGSTVRFNIEARNDLVPETTQPQVFRATIRIRAGGCADLDEREVLILIPPAAPNIG